MLSPGKVIEFQYPTSTLISHRSHWRMRSVKIRSIRDLVKSPLTVDEFLRRPFLRRSRMLFSGIDLETQEVRKFYLGSSREFRSPGLLRIGLYEPNAQRPVHILSHGFLPTVADRKKLAATVKALAQQDLADLSIGILADDLRVIGFDSSVERMIFRNRP